MLAPVVDDSELGAEHGLPDERHSDDGRDVGQEHDGAYEAAAPKSASKGESGHETERDRCGRAEHRIDQGGYKGVEESWRRDHTLEVVENVVAEEARRSEADQLHLLEGERDAPQDRKHDDGEHDDDGRGDKPESCACFCPAQCARFDATGPCRGGPAWRHRSSTGAARG